MKKLPIILIPVVGVLLAGCRTATTDAQVKFTDLRPPPAATISDDDNYINIAFGNDITAPSVWTHPESRIEGNTIYVYGYHNWNWASHYCTVEIPANVSPLDLNVVWINPDGSTNAVPFSVSEPPIPAEQIR